MVGDDLIFTGFSDLERIQIINYHLSSLQTHSKQWSMVKIRDSLHPQFNKINDFDFSIFPPTNHENLHIPSDQDQEHHQQQPKDPSSKPPSQPLFLQPSDLSTQQLTWCSREGFIGWLGFGFEVLRAKICSMISLFGQNGATRGAFWSAAGMAVFVIWWWFCRRVRQRRRLSGRESVENLKVIIREKDEVRF